MKRIKLKNGLRILSSQQKTKSIAIEVSVHVGSNDEKRSWRGISHFIEHMLFEGTKTKTGLEIANSIEKLGGEFNAATSNERTVFYIKILEKHFDIALDALSDIIQNPKFDGKLMEKEKKVVLEEIKMVHDDPRYYQWVLFQKNLFKKHPTRNPVYGEEETVKNLSREDLLAFHQTYYVPNNMVISVAGDIKDKAVKIKRKFSGMRKERILRSKKVSEPRQTARKKVMEKRKLKHSYLVLGYKVGSRMKKDSYALDIIHAILGRGQSGRLFSEIRTKRGLAYEVGVYHEAESDYGIFAAYLSTPKENITRAVNLIKKEFDKLKNISQEDVNDAKTYIEGLYSLDYEDSQKQAELLAEWEFISDAKEADRYLGKIKKVSVEEIRKTAKKYLTDKYTLALIREE